MYEHFEYTVKAKLENLLFTSALFSVFPGLNQEPTLDFYISENSLKDLRLNPGIYDRDTEDNFGRG
jgi:hypothetical protein